MENYVFKLFASLGLDTSEYESGLNGAKGTAEGFGSKLKTGLGVAAKVTGAALTAASGVVTAFGKASVSAGKEFDTSMSQVAATMGYSVEELNDSTSEASKNFQKLRDFAQDMGSSTAFSASEAADALNYMALAGYDAKTSMKMLPNVLNLAAAGGIELAAASDMVTDAQSAFGLSLDDTSKMVDQMAMAASKSNTSVSQLGEAFLTIGANAKSLNGGTQELSTALGILADNGIKGSEAGTHMRNILLSLNPTTEAAYNAFQELGLNAYDASGELRPLEDIFADLSEGLSGMSTEAKDAYLSSMFNKTDLAAVNALLATNSERWDELSGYIGDAAGSANVMANTQLDNLAGDITLFESALEGAKIAVSDALTPALREFTQFGTESVQKLGDAFREDGIAGAMGTLGDILSDGLAMIMEELPKLAEGGLLLLESLMGGVADNLPLLADSAVQIVLMLTQKLLDPGNITALINAALGAVQVLSAGLVSALPELIPAVIQAVITIVNSLTSPSNMSMLINGAIDLAIGIMWGLLRAIPDIIRAVPQIVLNIVGAILKSTPRMIRAGFELLMGLAAGIGQAVAGVIKSVTDVAGRIIGAVKGIFGIHSPSKVFAGIGDYLMQGLGDGIEDGTKDAVKTAESAMGEVIDAASMDGDFGISSSVKAIPSAAASAVGAGAITMNVYGAQGQDVRELADIVSERISNQFNRGKAVFA